MGKTDRGRGALTTPAERNDILLLIADSIAAGCRKDRACDAINIECRTLQRWEKNVVDRRHGPLTVPANKLTNVERALVIKTSVSAEFVNLSPHQIVPKLADSGIFIASESTFYRILKSESLSVHRGHTKQRIVAKPMAYEAVRPNQIYSWDITYLQACVRGQFYYLYLFLDIFSKKIVGWNIHATQESNLSAILIEDICLKEKISEHQLVIHADNGGPMKGATMLATLQKLCVVPSFSRPSVSNDNPFSESLFKTLKYCPIFPSKPFESIEAAKAWMEIFVKWYNTEHLHSGINFVTPESKHLGLDIELLKNRNEVYEKAKEKNPIRWSGKTRNWSAVTVVKLNPLKEKEKSNTNTNLQQAC
jgi:transposase InsO family protein